MKKLIAVYNNFDWYCHYTATTNIPTVTWRENNDHTKRD